jgi:hypothetical protein
MYWDVVSARYDGEYRIDVEFRDGKHGVVDLKPLIDKGWSAGGLLGTGL